MIESKVVKMTSATIINNTVLNAVISISPPLFHSVRTLYGCRRMVSLET